MPATAAAGQAGEGARLRVGEAPTRRSDGALRRGRASAGLRPDLETQLGVELRRRIPRRQFTDNRLLDLETAEAVWDVRREHGVGGRE